MKTYRTIFRLDFPVYFSLVDHLGEHAQFLHQRLEDGAFKANPGSVNINLKQQSITFNGIAEQDTVELNLTTNSLTIEIRHTRGAPLETISRHPGILLGDEVVKKLDLASGKFFTRIGMREWVIEEKDEFKFTPLLNLIVRANNLLSSGLESSFAPPTDVALVLESKNEGDTFLRLSVGPYKREEGVRYFFNTPDIGEALIMDIDLWQKKISVPGFSLANTAKHFQRESSKLLQKISSDLSKELKNGV